MIKVLDQGYVQLVETWGSDDRIIEAARMSTNKGFQGWGYVCPDFPHDSKCRCKGTGKISGDEKLLAYLYNNKHSTPFEMAGLVIEVKAPIMVFREWHRHRTQSYNEMSARYIPLPDENYVPTPERCVPKDANGNKQAASVGANIPTLNDVALWIEKLKSVYSKAQEVYESGLDIGIPKEIARLPVPVARYSRMRASANLRNWLAFLTLRMNPAAQWEIRMYANAVGKLIENKFPRTWELFAAESKS